MFTETWWRFDLKIHCRRVNIKALPPTTASLKQPSALWEDKVLYSACLVLSNRTGDMYIKKKKRDADKSTINWVSLTHCGRCFLKLMKPVWRTVSSTLVREVCCKDHVTKMNHTSLPYIGFYKQWKKHSRVPQHPQQTIAIFLMPTGKAIAGSSFSLKSAAKQNKAKCWIAFRDAHPISNLAHCIICRQR